MLNGRQFSTQFTGQIVSILLFSTYFGYGLQREETTQNQVTTTGNNGTQNLYDQFWDGAVGQEYVAKLKWDNLEKFNEEHKETFVMFYANWCKSSVQAKGEFAMAAQDLAYTEGYDHIQFGAFDCNATLENKRVCNKKFNVINYPRFFFFENGHKSRMYTIKCPKYAEFFYNWIVDKGNEKYCSGSLSLARATSSAGLTTCSSPVLVVSSLVVFCGIHFLLNLSKKLF